MTKKPVQFRFFEESLARLDWLQQHLDLNRTEAVTLAVAELYERYCATRLVRAEGEQWVLMIGEKPMSQVNDRTVARLAEIEPGFVAQLKAGVSNDTAVVALFEMLLDVLD